MSKPLASVPGENSLSAAIVELAQNASVELSVHDVKQLQTARRKLPDSTRLYVSHLPKQTWAETQKACAIIRAEGLEPVPHIPIRLISDTSTLNQVIGGLAQNAQVRAVLLIAGDYAKPIGAYHCSAQVLQTGVLGQFGIKDVSLAGHPEGHPLVPLETIRPAEADKACLAARLGLRPTLLTQFFFEAAPFLEWAKALRARDTGARLVAGLAGPTSIASLVKLAARCGVGPSVRALSAKPSSLFKILSEHGPEQVLRDLAAAQQAHSSTFDGIHLFSFGGFARTCQWLCSVREGHFELNENGAGFAVSTS